MMSMMSSDFNVECLPEPYRTNVRVWRHTQSVCKLLPPPKVATTKVCYDPTFAWHQDDRRKTKTHVQVVPMDTLKAAQGLMTIVPNIAVLNLADDSFPTGCVDTGSTAQEESLCRSSTLSHHLDMRHYPLRDGELLYSSGVLVFKDSAANGFRPLDRPYEVDVISCPGLRHPQLTSESRLSDVDRERLRVKVCTIFQAAYKHGRRGLVLGSLGCGAWRSPPEEVAAVFKSVLEECDGAFEEVIFAVLPQTQCQQLFAPHTTSSSSSSRRCNFQTFSSVLT